MYALLPGLLCGLLLCHGPGGPRCKMEVTTRLAHLTTPKEALAAAREQASPGSVCCWGPLPIALSSPGYHPEGGRRPHLTSRWSDSW